MKPLRRAPALLLFFLAYLLATNACGPFTSEALFVQTTVPDGSYAEYLQGHLGIVQPGFRMRYLVIAYDWLKGTGLTAGEQQQALALEDFINPAPGSTAIRSEPPAPGLTRWLEVRHNSELPGEPTNTLAQRGKPTTGPNAFNSDTAFLLTDRKAPGGDYQSFPNCLDDAFANAAATLTARQAKHPGDKAAIEDWIRGQDLVFGNCASGSALPPDAPAAAPVWLRQDRAYQQAAANFYRTDYDLATQQFQAIAADTASPWHQTARFLIARTTIRRATVGQESDLPADARAAVGAPYSQARFDSLQKYQAALARERLPRLATARAELEAIVADPAMASFHRSASGLLDLVNLQLDPVKQADVLAARLTLPNRLQTPGKFRQALTDLHAYLGGVESSPSRITGANASDSELLTWLRAMRDANPISPFDSLQQHYSYARQAGERAAKAAQPAIDGWRQHRTTPWLIAALSTVQAENPAVPELLHEAANLPANSPAHLTVTYHRLRLAGPTPAARAEILTLLPALEQHESRSTINLFTILLRRTAPSYADFLATAATLPAATSIGDGDPFPLATQPNPHSLCQSPVSEADTLLFDHETATILNTRLPLNMLAEAAGDTRLPANLRFQIAQSAWTRAVLLDRREIAKALSPYLVSCYASWQPVLQRYDSAATPDDREAAGLLALMRFSSTEPIVRDGEQRAQGFATYDDFRDNWWPASDPGGAPYGSDSAQDVGPRLPGFFGTVPAPRDVLADPPFLKPGDRAAADLEIAALREVPCASDYFAQAAIKWQQAHPLDSRTPDILGNAERVIRSGCSTPATSELNHRLFTLVQTVYPRSEWAGRYTSWQ